MLFVSKSAELDVLEIRGSQGWLAAVSFSSQASVGSYAALGFMYDFVLVRLVGSVWAGSKGSNKRQFLIMAAPFNQHKPNQSNIQPM